MRITRYPNLSEPQFFGCTAAFVDSLTGELNAAAGALRRLENRAKGSAFAYEMELDNHRYGALIVLDRWSTVLQAFGPHLELSRHPGIVSDGAARVEMAERTMQSANRLLDAADHYSPDVVEACLLALRSVQAAFAEECEEAEQSAKLGPMLPEEYTSAQRIFREDLAAR